MTSTIKLIRLLFLFLFLSINAIGQDTTFYKSDNEKVSSFDEAHYFEVVLHDPTDTNIVTVNAYFISGQFKAQCNYSNYNDKELDGKVMEWYENGQLRSEIDYTKGKYDGQLLTYWENGNPKRIDNYKEHKLIDGKCFHFDGTETVYYDYEQLPEFPGGEQGLVNYLTRTILYPPRARYKGIQGEVKARFIVNKDGTVSDAQIIEGIEELNYEALRIINKMPAWQPGMRDGETLSVQFTLPIKFTLR